MNNQSETVTKAAAARRWQIGRSNLASYSHKGMPIRGDGLLDWDAVRRWRADWIRSEISGSYQYRQRAKAAKGKTEDAPRANIAVSDQETVVWNAGYVRGFTRARINIRSLTELFATMRPEFVEERIGVLSIIDFMLESWLDVPENTTERMPRIEWKHFTRGITPKAAKQLFEALQADLATCDSAGGNA